MECILFLRRDQVAVSTNTTPCALCIIDISSLQKLLDFGALSLAMAESKHSPRVVIL